MKPARPQFRPANPRFGHRVTRAVATGSAVFAVAMGAPATAAAAPGPCAGTVCSFDVPDGQYEIMMLLGGPDAAQTGINVEGRRVALAPVSSEWTARPPLCSGAPFSAQVPV